MTVVGREMRRAAKIGLLALAANVVCTLGVGFVQGLLNVSELHATHWVYAVVFACAGVIWERMTTRWIEDDKAARGDMRHERSV